MPVFMTVREALCQALAEEFRRDEKVFIIGEEVAEYQGAYKVTQGLLDEFGAKRVIDTPISEYGFAGIGVGAALMGLKPVVEFMTFNFALQAIDQVINTAAKTHYMSGGLMECPIVFRGPNGPPGRVGAQHSQCFASWYASVPGLKVVCPYFASDCKGLLKSAIRDPNPVVFLENEVAYGHKHQVPDEDEFSKDFLIEIGKANVVKHGSDVTVVSFSLVINKVMEAASSVEEELDISVEVIDLRTLRPLDMDTVVKSVRKTNRLVIVENGWPICGIGAEVSCQVMELAFDYLDAPIRRVSALDVPTPYAANLEAHALPQPSDVREAIIEVCS